METGNQGNNNQETNTNNQEKTFTQEEMNRILGERLAREREKFADYDSLKEKAEKFDKAEEASKSELQKQTEKANELQKKLDQMNAANKIREIREKVAKEKRVPANLLNGSTEEECKAQADAILSFAKPDAYPAVPDGGEVSKSGGKKETRDQFAEWVEKATKGGN